MSTICGIRGGAAHVLGEAGRAAQQAQPAGASGLPRRLGVQQRDVARRQRLPQVLRQEPHPLARPASPAPRPRPDRPQWTPTRGTPGPRGAATGWTARRGRRTADPSGRVGPRWYPPRCGPARPPVRAAGRPRLPGRQGGSPAARRTAPWTGRAPAGAAARRRRRSAARPAVPPGRPPPVTATTPAAGSPA